MTNINTSQDVLLKHLIALLQGCSDIYAAVVATIDGYPLAACSQEHTLPEKQLAAMSSTLVSLGDSVAEMLKQGACKNILVENEHGTILVLHAGDNMVLMSGARPDARLGTVLSYSRTAAATISATEVD